MNKRGVSNVVVSVLVILISIVAVGIVWVFVQPLINESASGVVTDCFNNDMYIKTCTYDDSTVSVLVSRGSANGNVSKVRFVFEQQGNRITLDSDENAPGPIESKRFIFSRSQAPIPSYVQAIAILPNGKLCPSNNVQVSWGFGALSYGVCNDGKDNDDDGWKDGEDPACFININSLTEKNNPDAGTPECSDGINNDDDSDVDWPADLDCTEANDMSESQQDNACSNEIDDDHDGKIDGFDPSCRGRFYGSGEYHWTEEQDDCFDGIDNDGDSAIDNLDFSCVEGGSYESTVFAQCQDGIDNDYNGITDFVGGDPNCDSTQDNFEYTQTSNIWQKVNGNNPVDVGSSFLPASRMLANRVINLRDSSQNIVYFFEKQQPYGSYVGRFNVGTKSWEILNFSGWSNSSSTVIKPFSEDKWSDSGINVFNHPSKQNTLIGTIAAAHTEGGIPLDIHDRTYSFLFNDTGIDYWSAENDYGNNLVTPLALSFLWAAGYDNSLASDGMELLSVIRTGVWEESVLGAAKYDFGTETWQNWELGQWKNPTNKVQFGPTMKLPFSEINSKADTAPAVTAIPSKREFIVTYLSSNLDSTNPSIRAAKYNAVSGVWSWWKNGAWSTIGTPDNLISNVGNSLENYKQTAVSGNKMYMFYEIYNGEVNNLNMISYDADLATWTLPQQITTEQNYIIKTDPSENVWLVYNHEGEIISTKITNGLFSPHTIVYHGNLTTKIMGLDFIGSLPVLFIGEKSGEDYRIFAVSDKSTGYWTGEKTRNSIFPSETKLDLAHGRENSKWGTTVKINVSYTDYNLQEDSHYGDTFCGHMALDSEGKIYCPKVAVDNLGIFPYDYSPPAPGQLDSAVSWGGWWDYLEFPSSVSVDNSRGIVYITDHIMEGHETDENNTGGIQIWRKSWNNISIIENNQFYTVVAPRLWNIIRTDRAEPNHHLNWPADSAIDEQRGILYVTESNFNRILKYNVTNPDSIQFLGSFGSYGSAPGQFNNPKGIDIDSIGNIYVVDSKNHRIQKFDSNNNFVTQFGSLGYGNGNLLYPYAISIDRIKSYVYVADSGNGKIEIFDLNGNQKYGFSSWDSSFGTYVGVRSFNQIGGILANNNRLYVSTQGSRNSVPIVVSFNMSLP